MIINPLPLNFLYLEYAINCTPISANHPFQQEPAHPIFVKLKEMNNHYLILLKYSPEATFEALNTN